MKIEWLVANATPVGFPQRAEHDNFGIIFGTLWPIQATFKAGEQLCDVGIPFGALIILLRVNW